MSANSRMNFNISYLGKCTGVVRSVSCSFLFTGQIRFALHQRLPTASLVPLTSKSQQEATRGKVRSSVELVSDSESSLTVASPHSRQAAAQLHLSYGLSSAAQDVKSCCAASALPGWGNGNFRQFSRVLIPYISLLSGTKWKNSPPFNTHSCSLFELV